MGKQSVEDIAGRVEAKLAEKLGVRGDGLSVKTRRAGRLVPRRVRKDLEQIIEAQQQAGNPKLAVQLDIEALMAAEGRVMAWAKTVDPARRKTDLILSIAGGVALSVLAVFALVVVVLVWRGFV